MSALLDARFEVAALAALRVERQQRLEIVRSPTGRRNALRARRRENLRRTRRFFGLASPGGTRRSVRGSAVSAQPVGVVRPDDVRCRAAAARRCTPSPGMRRLQQVVGFGAAARDEGDADLVRRPPSRRSGCS